MAWAARPVLTGGSRITDDKLDALLDRVELLSSMPRAVKTADQDVTSSTTVVDDTHLQLSLLANVDYDIIGMLMFEGATAGDLKLQWAWTPSSTGLELSMGGIGPTAGVTSFEGDAFFLARTDVTSSPSSTYTLGINTGTWGTYIITGNVNVGSSNTTLKLRWAQNASSGTATKIKARSWLRAIPLFT